MDAFADKLADNATVGAAARAIGISQQAGSALLAKMRRELGWQAQ